MLYLQTEGKPQRTILSVQDTGPTGASPLLGRTGKSHNLELSPHNLYTLLSILSWEAPRSVKALFLSIGRPLVCSRFTLNRSGRRAIPDYVAVNQWCWTCVSRNGNHFLLMNSKESQFAIQFIHYRLPLCPVQLCAVSRADIVAKSNEFLLSNDSTLCETGNE